MGDKVGENPAALRAAVFFAILEKPEGGGGRSNAPPAGRGLKRHHEILMVMPMNTYLLLINR